MQLDERILVILGLLYIFGHTVEGSQPANAPPQCEVTTDTANCSFIHLAAPPTDLQPNIKVLYLDGNNVRTLLSNNFKYLPALTNLSIANSKVSTIDVDAFKGLRNLLSLDLRNNKIGAFDTNPFNQDLKNLTSLYLQSNSIPKITKDLFNNLINLKVLHLEQNKLKFIHAHAFTKLTSLTWISIDHNELDTAYDGWFRPMVSTLTHISLHHNPWNCSTNMCDFKKWSQQASSKISSMIDVHCKYANKTLKSIHVKRICKNNTKPTDATTTVHPTKTKHTKGGTHDKKTSKIEAKSGGGGGAAAAVIIILLIIVAVAVGFWYIRRKRRNYGLLSDESVYQPTYDDPSESMRIPSQQSTNQVGVGEAYV